MMAQLAEGSEQRRVTVTARSFRTPEGQARFEAAYTASLSLWPVPHERFDVPTRFGPTHVVAAGPIDAPPLLLIHAFGAGASSWYANVGALSQRYRVYAIDTIGDTTNSVMTKTIRQRAQFAEWLTDVMDALGVERAPIVGHSYGGWLTLNAALCLPERVERIALCAPAGSFIPLNFRFQLMNLRVILFQNRAATDAFYSWCVKPGNRVAESLSEQFFQGLTNFKWQYVVRPNTYTDAELAQIRVPTLLLYGDHEVIYDWRKALGRAERLLPNLSTAVIPDAGHFLIAEQAERVNQKLLEFLER